MFESYRLNILSLNEARRGDKLEKGGDAKDRRTLDDLGLSAWLIFQEQCHASRSSDHYLVTLRRTRPYPLLSGVLNRDLRQYSCDTPISAIGMRRQLELRY